MKAKKKQNKHNISEQELLDTIELITKKLAYKFRFGYHEIEDMRQQISIFAIEGLEKYDHERPLENFLWTHVRNRLFNYKRDNYQRPDSPCVACPFRDRGTASSDNNCTKFSDKYECELYRNWFSRNNSKKNLMYLNTIDDLNDNISQIKSHSQNAETKETISLIEEALTGENRHTYLKIKYGNKVYKNEAQKLIKKIQEILNE